MFYCHPCGKRLGWPAGMASSVGPCEVCGKTSECNDVPSKLLPVARPQAETFDQGENPDQEALFKD
jgi:hypothetical protein